MNGHISNKFEVFDNIMITNWTNWEYLVPTILKEYTDNESADSIYQRSHSLPEQILDNIIKNYYFNYFSLEYDLTSASISAIKSSKLLEICSSVP